MAVAFDANLTTAPTVEDSSGTTVARATVAAAAAGALIFCLVGWDDTTVTLASVAGGGLTWTVHVQALAGANRHVAIASAHAPSGLASATTITATFSATAAGARTMAMFSMTGLVTGTTPVGTASSTTGTTTWSGGTIAGVGSGDAVVGFGKTILDAGTATPDTGYTEVHDFSASVRTHESVYRITAAAGSFTPGGTWSVAGSDTLGVAVAFAVLAGAPPQYLRPDGTTSAGLWVAVGAATLHASISEAAASDAEYAESAEATGTADAFKVTTANATDPLVSTGHIVRYRLGKNTAAGDAVQVTVRLKQGTTVIASWVRTVPDSATTYTETLTAAQADSITDYTLLDLEFEGVKI